NSMINELLGDSSPFGFALARFAQGYGHLLQGSGACPELVEGLGMTNQLPVRLAPSQKNFVGRLISGGKLLCTGQFSAVCSNTSRCGEFGGNGMCTSDGSATIRRGASFDISFCTETVMPRRSTPSSSAFIPMVVLMQVPRAVATRSVGENASPLPLLSAGASVAIFDWDGPWVASQ